MKISIALATYNEAEFLDACLKSIADWAFEIVIVDGGSTDQTIAIGQKYKARMYHRDNPPIFHINKQFAIDKCLGDWVLQLDADEVVSEDLRKEILEKVMDKEINGYWIPRKNFFLGRFLMKGGQYPDHTMRLYRRGKGRLPCKSVHEQAEVVGKTAFLNNALLHFADKNFSRYLLRYNRYTNLIATELYEQKLPKNVFSAFDYMLVKPLWWFLKTYIRHKGFMDLWQGFVFSFFSALRFPIAFYKYVTQY